MPLMRANHLSTCSQGTDNGPASKVSEQETWKIGEAWKQSVGVFAGAKRAGHRWSPCGVLGQGCRGAGVLARLGPAMRRRINASLEGR